MIGSKQSRALRDREIVGISLIELMLLLIFTFLIAANLFQRAASDGVPRVLRIIEYGN